MKMIGNVIISAFLIMFIAGCAGNPESKTEKQSTDTLAVQVSEELSATMDSAAVALDSAKQAIEESTRELNQLLNDLNK